MFTREEYFEKLKAIRKENGERIIAFQKEFARMNNTVKIGDVVSDGMDTIIVERFGVFVGLDNFPEMRYVGKRLTKKGVPFKGGSEGCVYQSRLKK